MNKKLIALILIVCLLFSVFVFAKPFPKYGKSMAVQKKPLSTTLKYVKAKQAFDEAKYKAQEKALPITSKYAKQLLAYNNKLEYKMQKNDFSIFHQPWKPKTLLKKTFWFFDEEKKEEIEIPIEIYYIDENSFRFTLLKKVEDEEPVIMHLFSNSPTYVSRESGCEAYYYPVSCDEVLNTYPDYPVESCVNYPVSCGNLYCAKYCGTSTFLCQGDFCHTSNPEDFFIWRIHDLCDSCSYRQQTISSYYNRCADPFCHTAWIDPLIEYTYSNLCIPSIDCPGAFPANEEDTCLYKNSARGCESSPNCTPSECNEQDYYGPYKYYCDGNHKRKHRRFYNYSCGTNGCYLESSDYVNDRFVETCSNGCSNGECNSASIECYSDFDCGSDGYTGSAFCKNNDVYQKYKTYDCRNAGTSNADCRSSTTDRKRQDCEYGCSDGSCNSSSNCHSGSLGGPTYCSSSCKCDVGEGDCDYDYECKSGLKCVEDVGPNYGFGVGIDVCEQPGSPSCSSGWKCKDNEHRAYQNSNCSWSSVTYCQHGCSNGSCNSPPQDIECYNNSDCGSNGYIDDPFCRYNDVYQEYESYTCHNAGATNSYCDSSTTYKKKEECGSQGCTDGTCNITLAECTSGPCCNTQSGTFKPSTEKCGADYYVNEFYCADFSSVWRKKMVKYCSGNNKQCTGRTRIVENLPFDSCAANEVCSEGECVTQAPSNYCSDSDDWAPSWCSDAERIYKDSENVEYKQSFKWNNSHLNAFKALNKYYVWEFRRDDDYWDYWTTWAGFCHGDYWTNLPAPHDDLGSEEKEVPLPCMGNYIIEWAQADEEFEVKTKNPEALQSNRNYWVKVRFKRKVPNRSMLIHTESEYTTGNYSSSGVFYEMVKKQVVS